MSDSMSIDETSTTETSPEELAKIEETKKINEEYKIWKKHAVFLYDVMMSRALEWPTLTTQWLPDIRSPPDEQYDYHRLLFGTHTSNDRPNYLQIAEVKIPHLIADPKKYDEERGEIGGHEQPKQHLKFDITQKILHPGEVNKARYMWQNPNIIATMCADGKTLIFDRTKHPLNPANDTEFKPQIELSKHKQEGYGLHWSPLKEGHLATASIDGTVKLWDISQYTTAGKNQKSSMKAARTYEHHTAAVNDLEYHPSLWFALATVSDDQTLQILDQRTDSNRAAYKTVQQAHNDEISSVAWNPAKEMLLATGSADKTAAIWDLRNLKAKLHACEGHTGPVTKVEWHPKHREILATSAQDRRIIFWDLSQVGEEQTPENAEDGPPELMFMHGGHTNVISDFTFNKTVPWLMCSAAEDNLIQVWRASSTLVGRENEDVPLNELQS